MRRRPWIIALLLAVAVCITAWWATPKRFQFDFIGQFKGEQRQGVTRLNATSSWISRPLNGPDAYFDYYEFTAPSQDVLNAMIRELTANGWAQAFNDGELVRFEKRGADRPVIFTSAKDTSGMDPTTPATCLIIVPRRSSWAENLFRIGTGSRHYPLADTTFLEPSTFTWTMRKTAIKTEVTANVSNLGQFAIDATVKDCYLNGYEPDPAAPYNFYIAPWSRKAITLTYPPEAYVADKQNALEGTAETGGQTIRSFYNWNNPPDAKAHWQTLSDGQVAGITLSSGHGRPMEIRSLVLRVDGIELLVNSIVQHIPASGSVEVKFASPKPDWITAKANLLFYDAMVSPNKRWRKDISSVN